MSLRPLARSLAVQDWCALGYLSLMFLALCVGTGPGRPRCLAEVGADLAVTALAISAARGSWLPWGTLARAVIYRVGILGALCASYMQLREVLPAVNPHSLDAQIYAFDLAVFRYEP